MAMCSLPTRAGQSWQSETICLPRIADLLGDVPSAPPLASVSLEQRPAPSRSNSFPVLPSINRFYQQTPEMLPTTNFVRLQQIGTGNCEAPCSHSPQNGRGPPPMVNTGRPSPCSVHTGVYPGGDVARLEGLLNGIDPDISAIVRCISELLGDTVRPAYDHGWFQPNASGNNFSKRLEGKIVGKGMDELVRDFFFRDENLATYGERVSIPRKPAKPTLSSEEPGVKEELDLDGLIKLKRREESTKAHQKIERVRRDRHRDLQRQGCLRCCDISMECGCEHAKEVKDKEQIRSQGGKGPGKDEQLWTAIYQHELAGRVVQSVNDGRKRAEKAVHLLLEFIVRQPSREPRRPRDSTETTTSPTWNYVGRKRSCDEVERDPAHPWTASSTDIDSESDRSRSSSSTGGSPWKRARGLSQDPGLSPGSLGRSDISNASSCSCKALH